MDSKHVCVRFLLSENVLIKPSTKVNQKKNLQNQIKMIIRLTTRTVNHLQSIHRSSNFLSSYCGWCINRIDHHQVQPLFVRNYIGQFHHHRHQRLSQKYNGGHRLLSTKSSEIPSPSPSPNDDDNHQKSSKLNVKM